MHGYDFTGCCGLGIVSGFNFDRDTEFQAPVIISPDAFLQAEGTKNCNLIALTSLQRGAQLEVQRWGYVPFGKFISTHENGTEVTLFAKGLTPMSEEIARRKQAPRPKKVRVVKIAARKGKGI